MTAIRSISIRERLKVAECRSQSPLIYLNAKNCFDTVPILTNKREICMTYVKK